MREYFENYLTEYDFPNEAKEVFLNAYDKIVANKTANALLQKHYLEVLNKGEKTGYAWGILIYQKQRDVLSKY